MSAKVAILTIGSEILDGRIVDTNSSFLGRSLRSRAIGVATRVTCDDDLQIIVGWIRELLSDLDLVVITGGLGPTPDDLTRDAIASFLGVELVEDCSELNKLKKWYEEKGRVLTDINSRQAWFPEGALTINNPEGTASGIWIETEIDGLKKAIVALPGIPKELHPMWNNDVLDRISSFYNINDPMSEWVIRTFGLPESEVAKRVSAAVEVSNLEKNSNHKKTFQIAYQVMFPETIVLIRSQREDHAFQDAVRAAIGPQYIVSERYDQPLPAVVGRVLINRGLTISVAESCTGGGIGELLTRYAGSSSYFLGGVIAYSNHIKKDVLGVSPTLLLNDGAVSSAVVEAMADGVRLLTQSSIAVSISGIAGPDGGGPKKPVGTFFVGLATDSGTKSYEFFFSSDRERIRSFAAYKALEVVRRELLNLPIPEDVRPS